MSKAEQCVNEALGKLGTVIYNNLSDKDRVLVEGEIKKLLTKVASGTENNKANHERASRYLKQVAFQAMEDEAKFAQLMLGWQIRTDGIGSLLDSGLQDIIDLLVPPF